MIVHREQPRTSPLADLIERQGRRKSWLAKQVGVSPTLVSMWLSGRRRIRAEHVARIAELLGVETWEVTGQETGQAHCERCGHWWQPRGVEPPGRCPRCHSPPWHRPRAAAGGEAVRAQQWPD